MAEVPEEILVTIEAKVVSEVGEASQQVISIATTTKINKLNLPHVGIKKPSK